MTRFLRLLLLLAFVGLRLDAAEQATVNHGVSLRGDPSTANPPIGHLNKNSTVTLLAKKPRAGFYHVQTADGTKGWVGVNYLTVEEAGTPTEPTKPTKPTHPGKPTKPVVGSTGCDDSLWQHVYNPQRLIVNQKCTTVTTVTGTIVDATKPPETPEPDGVRHEADGDTHGWLKVDPQFANLLNAGNNAEGGNLVFEIVCKYTVTQPDAKGTPGCQGYTGTLTIPPVGSHVRIVGSYVQDKEHKQWMEIHPVTSITVIP